MFEAFADVSSAIFAGSYYRLLCIKFLVIICQILIFKENMVVSSTAISGLVVFCESPLDSDERFNSQLLFSTKKRYVPNRVSVILRPLSISTEDYRARRLLKIKTLD